MVICVCVSWMMFESRTHTHFLSLAQYSASKHRCVSIFWLWSIIWLAIRIYPIIAYSNLVEPKCGKNFTFSFSSIFLLCLSAVSCWVTLTLFYLLQRLCAAPKLIVVLLVGDNDKHASMYKCYVSMYIWDMRRRQHQQQQQRRRPNIRN